LAVGVDGAAFAVLSRRVQDRYNLSVLNVIFGNLRLPNRAAKSIDMLGEPALQAEGHPFEPDTAH
jgi:hypothetical protein